MNESNKFRTILLWALLPVVCFACAIPLTKWFVSENGVKSPVNYDAMAWGKIIASSPDIVFQDVDSIRYYGWQKRVSLKKDSVTAADITSLFPEFGVRKLTILDKGDLNPIFEIWNNNGTLYFGWIDRQKDGGFVLKVNENNVGKIIPIGKFTGRMPLQEQQGMNKPLTTMNVVAIVTLLLCVLGLGFLSTSMKSSKDDIGWLAYVSIGSTLLPLAYVVLWILGWWQFEGSVYNYPEWIALAWLISEIGLLSGIVHKLYESEGVSSNNIFERNVNKLKSRISPIGEWKEVDGQDSLIINSDGTIYYSSPGQTAKFTFQIGDEGSIIASDIEDKVVIAKYEVHPSSPQWYPIMKLVFDGKTFTKNGQSYESTAECYISENKQKETRAEVMKSLGVPDNNGSWGWVIVSAAFAIFIGFRLPHTITHTVYNHDGIIGVALLCAVFLIALYGVIWNLWLIFVGRKRRTEVNRLFDTAYQRLHQPQLTEYIRAALKHQNLGVKEWEEQNSNK